MKRFLIHVSTHWCGEEDTFRAVAESESDLWDLAEQLAYDNFYSYGHDQDIAKEVCKARFLGNWKLKIVDYSGKDLDSEILISEL